jgi:hypothetical protein
MKLRKFNFVVIFYSSYCMNLFPVKVLTVLILMDMVVSTLWVPSIELRLVPTY